MKAALNGVPSLSILDGWWIEGCAENTTGWAIENGETEEIEANNLYNKLEKVDRSRYGPIQTPGLALQQHCIGINGTFFNTQRMLGQYFSNAYFPSGPSRFQVELSADSEEGFGLSETAFVPVNKA